MYLRTISRRNRDGSTVRYLQLAHNVWDPERGYARAEVVHSFGREDQLDRDALARLVRSMSRFFGSGSGACGYCRVGAGVRRVEAVGWRLAAGSAVAAAGCA